MDVINDFSLVVFAFVIDRNKVIKKKDLNMDERRLLFVAVSRLMREEMRVLKE